MFVEPAAVDTDALLQTLLEAAEAHGEESGSEHETGDLQDPPVVLGPPEPGAATRGVCGTRGGGSMKPWRIVSRLGLNLGVFVGKDESDALDLAYRSGKVKRGQKGLRVLPHIVGRGPIVTLSAAVLRILEPVAHRPQPGFRRTAEASESARVLIVAAEPDLEKDITESDGGGAGALGKGGARSRLLRPRPRRRGCRPRNCRTASTSACGSTSSPGATHCATGSRQT